LTALKHSNKILNNDKKSRFLPISSLYQKIQFEGDYNCENISKASRTLGRERTIVEAKFHRKYWHLLFTFDWQKATKSLHKGENISKPDGGCSSSHYLMRKGKFICLRMPCGALLHDIKIPPSSSELIESLIKYFLSNL